MNEAAFLDSHNAGIGRLLGIRFLRAAKDGIAAEVAISPAHLNGTDAVHGGVIMALADCAGAYGAVLNLPAGHTTATIESKTNFLRRGRGEVIRAEATPLHVGRTLSVWRSQISRGDGGAIAEVTQTQIYVPARDSAVAAAATPNAARGENGGKPARGSTAGDRRQQIFEAACQVITRQGFAHASIREVAKAAGMPIPTMYQYIQGKDDLLLLIYRHFMNDVGQAMRAAVATDAPAHDSLSRLIRALLGTNNENQKYIRLMFQETKSLDAAMRRQVFDIDAENIAVLRGLLQRCRKAGIGAFGQDEIAANLIYFMCSIWALRHWTLGKFPRAQVDDAIKTFIERGLGISDRKTKLVQAVAQRAATNQPRRTRHG